VSAKQLCISAAAAQGGYLPAVLCLVEQRLLRGCVVLLLVRTHSCCKYRQAGTQHCCKMLMKLR
jgi:hypothetical protein